MKTKLILFSLFATVLLSGCDYGHRKGTFMMVPYSQTAPDPVYPLVNTTPNGTSAAGVAGVR
ncbi:hypothetical protein CVU37_11025 [candidate division BRC1 bacterium HGW-BRC1-1]|jgi:hypothetical protein|nr:MAG: hypothetical protein CVU37_11025 [candidate division BRC1 bacterium HGW-BRC1-1]